MLCKRCPAYSGRDSVLGFQWELREPVITMLREKYKSFGGDNASTKDVSDARSKGVSKSDFEL